MASIALAPQQGSAPGSGAFLSGMRKAAILLVALGDEVAKLFLQKLSRGDVQQLTDEIARLGDIPQVQLNEVILEFCHMLDSDQTSVRGGPDFAARLLMTSFGEQLAQEMIRDTAGLRDRGRGDLAKLQKIDPQQLSKFLEKEHPQTVALVLAHLDAKRGSTLLMHLDGKLRVDTVRRLAEMRQFSPEMAEKVGAILTQRMEAMGSTGRRSYAGFKAVAELLNRLDMTASRTILEEIERDEPKLAIGIRNMMFTWEDLLTVPEPSIREIVSAVDKRALALALKGSRENLRAHIFKAMSSRAVEMMKDDMEAMGPVRSKEVGAAQQEVLSLAHTLEAEGKVTLKMESDDELAV